ncbi:uncharacterized protein Nmlp_2785 [Natronomonas moolapensis 8.8.11]|uniref:Uncharacterized protein n=1 Tax=Natronomonas moolapensis (strain DSM 18674 / CECT 7526 / JCM 14361 / 8.8.11) TaxID=268739 RepID=M1XRS9_NATM8|nr:hypothetical protein [Natronomonas moolapensis]CCQ36938.1 uncharacterized protein Nmlp_2785 [Natronomonas moolapensis 8.8.11]
MYRLCVALLLVLAGCSGTGGTVGDSPPAPTETVTPVAVPDADPERGRPTGIDGSGVSDSRSLAAAHDRRLEERSYRLVSNQTVRYANGTVRSQYLTDLRLAANRTYFVTVRTNGPAGPRLLGEPPAVSEFWSDGETYVRAFGTDDPTYNEFAPTASGVGTWRFWATTGAFEVPRSPTTVIAESLDAVPTRVESTRSVGGSERYRLVDVGAPDAELPFRAAAPARNVSLVAVVDRSGLVRRLEIEYDGRIDGNHVVASRSIAYSDVGTTEVRRPAWFDRAT